MLPLQVTGTKYCEDKSVPAVVIGRPGIAQGAAFELCTLNWDDWLARSPREPSCRFEKDTERYCCQNPHDLDHRTYLTSNCPFPRNPLVSMLHRRGVMQDFGHSHRPPCINAISKLGVAGGQGYIQSHAGFWASAVFCDILCCGVIWCQQISLNHGGNPQAPVAGLKRLRRLD